jgi:hypothetical protein
VYNLIIQDIWCRNAIEQPHKVDLNVESPYLGGDIGESLVKSVTGPIAIVHSCLVGYLLSSGD